MLLLIRFSHDVGLDLFKSWDSAALWDTATFSHWLKRSGLGLTASLGHLAVASILDLTCQFLVLSLECLVHVTDMVTLDNGLGEFWCVWLCCITVCHSHCTGQKWTWWFSQVSILQRSHNIWWSCCIQTVWQWWLLQGSFIYLAIFCFCQQHARWRHIEVLGWHATLMRVTFGMEEWYYFSAYWWHGDVLLSTFCTVAWQLARF